MTRPTLLLAVLTAALGLGTVYFYLEHRALARSIAQGKEQCSQLISRLEAEHEARMRHLLEGQWQKADPR